MGQYENWYITILIYFYSFVFDEEHVPFAQLPSFHYNLQVGAIHRHIGNANHFKRNLVLE